MNQKDRDELDKIATELETAKAKVLYLQKLLSEQYLLKMRKAF